MRRISLITTSIMLLAAPAFAQTNTQERMPTPPVEAAIDYPGFLELSETVRAYRNQRLVSKDVFLDMAQEEGTVILDTRSKAAYDYGHIDGAVHLNFSDFTDTKLAKVIGSKSRRILIYCNNNFTNNVTPFATKRIRLALNVPTFINLYGYGYTNIYELEDAVDMNDPAMRIVGTGG